MKFAWWKAALRWSIILSFVIYGLLQAQSGLLGWRESKKTITTLKFDLKG